MKLNILSPTSSKFVNIDWIELDSLKGNLVIQHGHKPVYVVVKPDSIVKWQLSTKIMEELSVKQAFLEVQREKALLIINKE